MVKMTISGVEYEGTPQELKELFEKLGAKLPVEAEGETTYRKVTDREPKVGDYIMFEEAPYSFLSDGKYYEILEIDEYNDPQIIDDDGDEYDTAGDDDFEVYEKVGADIPKEESFKVGDYAKVVQERHSNYGKIVKIISTCYSATLPYDTQALDGEVADAHIAEQLVKVIEEEVEQARAELVRKQIEEEWAKIGRKPNEFREGDIVRLFNATGNHSYDKRNYGGEVVGFGGTDFARIKHFGYGQDDISTESVVNLVLIAPVESRVDLA